MQTIRWPFRPRVKSKFKTKVLEHWPLGLSIAEATLRNDTPRMGASLVLLVDTRGLTGPPPDRFRGEHPVGPIEPHLPDKVQPS